MLIQVMLSHYFLPYSLTLSLKLHFSHLFLLQDFLGLKGLSRINNSDHLFKTQCSAGKIWVLVFM